MNDSASRHDGATWRSVIARIWGPAAFCLLGSMFMMVGGPTGDDVRGSENAAPAAAPTLASVASVPFKPATLSTLERSIATQSQAVAAGAAWAASKPFPILPFAAGMLLVLALALHLAAWRLAR